MILHLSNALIKRLKCPISLEGTPVLQAGRLDAWSGHTFRIGRIEHIMMMNDACKFPSSTMPIYCLPTPSTNSDSC